MDTVIAIMNVMSEKITSLEDEMILMKSVKTNRELDEKDESQKERETVPSLTSDMGKKTVLVLAHSFLPPERAKSVIRLSIDSLIYSRK